MAYPITDDEWQNPTGWLRDERTGLYSWIDPITKRIVKSTMAPVLPDRPPEIQEEVSRRGLTDFVVDKEGRVLSGPEAKYVAWQQKETEKVREDITDPYILYDKKDATWRESHKMNYQIDMMEARGDPFLQQIAQQEYMQGLAQLDTERQQNRVMIKAIEDDEDSDDKEKLEAITKVLDKTRAPVRLFGVTRLMNIQQQQQRQKQQLLAQQENAPLTDEDLQLALQFKVNMDWPQLPGYANTPAEIRQQIRVKKLKQTLTGMGRPTTPISGKPTAIELRKRGTKEAYELGVKLGYWK